MAKKKAKAGKKKAPKKKVAKKKVAKLRTRKTPKKKVARKAARKVARKAPKRVAKKTARKTVKTKKSVKRPKAKRAAKPATLPKPATKPKLPRRTKQALPPESRITPPPVVDVEPITPPTTPRPAPTVPAAPSTGFAPPTIEAEVVPPPPAFALKFGDLAPDFELPDQSGQMHKLSQYRGKKVVLYFYPKDDTPGCTTEACGFRDSLGLFADRGAAVLGISPDPVGSHQRFAQKYGLTFPLLADEGHHVAERYGVWVEKNRYGEISMGIARTTFVIDADGRIKHVFHDVHADGHDQEVLGVL